MGAVRRFGTTMNRRGRIGCGSATVAFVVISMPAACAPPPGPSPALRDQDPRSIYGTPQLDATDVAIPVSGNRNGHTRVSIETAGGHFVATTDTTAGSAFLDAVDAGSTPMVDANAYLQPNFLTGCSGRWDDPPNRFGEQPGSELASSLLRSGFRTR